MGQSSSTPKYKQISIYIIPLVSLLIGLYLYSFSAPFFVKSIDPEYPYLINGLNCAMLHFNMIGHTDHPGTPFQLFCGLIIRLTYLFAGRNWSIASDVLNRPEFYLAVITISLTVLQSSILALIGKIGIKNIKLPFILILQLTPFFKDVFFNLFQRCNPERFMVIVMLLFIVVWLRYFVSEKSNQRKFALWSGVVLAMGFATKFNYLPVLLLPFFLLSTWKDRGIYTGAGIVSYAIFIAPIWVKFIEFRRFISGIINHEGLYGSGEENVFNAKIFFSNLKEIFFKNPEISIFFILIIFVLVFLLLKQDKSYKRQILFYSGFLIVLVLQILIVSKHFKNHYLLPLFLLYGILLFETGQLTVFFIKSNKLKNVFIAILPVFLLLVAIPKYAKAEIKDRAHDNYLIEASTFVKGLESEGYWYIIPSWMGAPNIENALIYGLSYCAERDRYKKELKKINPNVITWEGVGKPEKIWRCSVAPFDSLLKKGVNLYILSTPGRSSDIQIERIEKLADSLNISLKKEIIFNQEETKTFISELSTLPEKEDIVKDIQIIKQIPAVKENVVDSVDFNAKVKNWEMQIRRNKQWMDDIKIKAEMRKISVDSMVHVDAIYQANKKR